MSIKWDFTYFFSEIPNIESTSIVLIRKLYSSAVNGLIHLYNTKSQVVIARTDG